MLEAALAMLAEGRSVFPVKIERTSAGWSKRPMSARPMERAYTPEELTALWPADANGIGVELGKVSGLLRIDAEGPVPWETLGEKPTSGEFESVSKGRGWLLQYVDGVRTDTIWKGVGHQELRLMSDGTYTVVPPSEGYSWITPGLGRLPTWMLDRQAGMILQELTKELRPTTREPDRAEVLQALEAIPADDYHQWIRVGMALKESGYELEVWDEWSKKGSSYEEGACERKWGTFNKVGRVVSARCIAYIAEQHGYVMPNRHEPLTDVGNGRIFARQQAGRMLWHVTQKKWYAWNGKKWDSKGGYIAAEAAAKSVVQLRYDAAICSLNKAQSMNDDQKKAKIKGCAKVLSWCIAAQDASHIGKMLTMARSEPGMFVDESAFDQHIWYLNCANGILDLRTRELLPHDPQLYLTQLCPTAYDPQAQCPRWDRFLLEVFQGDTELVAFLQRLLGYCISGSTEQHVLPVWYGTGRNGKGTVVRAVIAALGSDFAMTLSSGFLAQHKNAQHPTAIASLYGKRFTADLETDDGMRLNEELVKRLTGGDELQARHMHEDFWSFKPTHKLVLATNYEPTVRNQDIAIWGRILKVPFNACFKGKEEKGLDDTLAAEAPGILRWLVEGCYAWQAMGLAPPSAVTAATEDYKGEQNTVAKFLEEVTVAGNSEQKTLKTVITTAYRAWCQLSNAQPVGPKAFGNAMKQAGVESDKNNYHITLRK